MSATLAVPKHQYKFKTVEEFETWINTNPKYADRRFEFMYGKIIEKQGMKQEEFFIVDFLLELFEATAAFKNKHGRLLPESDSHIDSKRKRVADLGYFTKKQILEARKGIKCAPAFAIEILSPNENLGEIEDKVRDYFDAGVQIVWYVSPIHKQIYLYTSPTDIKIYKGGDTISADPVLPDFSFKVKEMFKE